MYKIKLASPHTVTPEHQHSVCYVTFIVNNVWMMATHSFIERSGSGVELLTLDYENLGSNPGCCVKTLRKFFQSILLQFTQLYK